MRVESDHYLLSGMILQAGEVGLGKAFKDWMLGWDLLVFPRCLETSASRFRRRHPKL